MLQLLPTAVVSPHPMDIRVDNDCNDKRMFSIFFTFRLDDSGQFNVTFPVTEAGADRGNLLSLTKTAQNLSWTF